MKKIFIPLIIFFQFTSLASSATTYYISSSVGSDANSGTSIATPWQTFTILNATTLVGGDSVLLKSDDFFYGTILLHNSGNGTAPIYFGKYGNGNRPVISGFEQLSNWTSFGNIFSTSTLNNVRSIWLNGKWMQPARYPNTGFSSTLIDGSFNQIYNTAFSEPTNYWKGATMVVRNATYKYEMSPVDSFSSGTFFLQNSTSFIPQYSGFYLQNILSALDTANEWFYDSTLNEVRLIPPAGVNLGTADVKASVIDYGFYCSSNSSYITIDSLEFTGQAKDAIRFGATATYLNIENCKMSKCKVRGISIESSAVNSRMINNEVEDCGGDGLSAYFFKCKLQGNQIRRIGMHNGFGYDNHYHPSAISYSFILDTISENIIDSCGYAGIHLYGFFDIVENNFINHSMMFLEEGGGIVHEAYGQNVFIKNNFILNTEGNIYGSANYSEMNSGININIFCHDDSLINNTIINSHAYGVLIRKNNQNHFLKDNVIYNNQLGQINIIDGDTLFATKNIELRNNILYSLNNKQKDLKFNGKSFQFIPVKGDSNYFCNPYDYFPIYQQTDYDTVSRFKAFSLKQWNSLTTNDSNSHLSNVEWLNCKSLGSTGSDAMTNGDFTNNYDGWNAQPTSNTELLLDNLSVMDGGFLKYRLTDSLPVWWGDLISPPLSVNQNQYYQLSFSVAGTKTGILQSELRLGYGNYDEVGLRKYFPVTTMRKDYDYFFQPAIDASPCNLKFVLEKVDSQIYLDNIHITPVDVFHHDSTKMSKLLMNYSASPVTISWSDSVYRDLDGNIVSGSYTLTPYSSYVLVLDSPLILLSVKNPEIEKSISVFPNPVSRNGIVFVQLPEINNCLYRFTDLMGRDLQSGKFSTGNLQKLTMKNYASGIYLLEIISDEKKWVKKIMIAD